MDTKVGVETAAEYFARQAAEQDRRDREERRQARKDIRKRMLKTGLIKDDDMMRVDRARHRTTKAESAWFYTQSVMSLLDLAVAAALIYVGFITFKDDPLVILRCPVAFLRTTPLLRLTLRHAAPLPATPPLKHALRHTPNPYSMPPRAPVHPCQPADCPPMRLQIDPIAWQLAFGLTAVMIMIKFGLVVSDVQKGYAGWLGISCALSAGLLYGCVHRFFLLYNGQFPCFIGYDTWDPVPMCLTGMTFVALGGSVLFLLVDGALFYKYCQHRDYVKRKRTAGGHKEATLEDMMVHIELRMLQAMEREQSRVDGPGQAYLADSARGNKGTAGRSRQPSMAGVLRERSIVGSEVADAINKSRMSRMSIPGGEPRPGDLDLDHRKKSMKPLPAVVGEPGSQRTGNEADAARPPMRMLGDPIAQSNRAYSLR